MENKIKEFKHLEKWQDTLASCIRQAASDADTVLSIVRCSITPAGNLTHQEQK